MTLTRNSISLLTKLAQQLKPYQLYFEFPLVSVFVVGLIMKDPQLSPSLSMVSLSTLAAFYAVMSFYKSYDIKALQYTYKILYLSFTVGIMGILYQLMHLPGAKNMSIIGLGIMAVCLVALLVLGSRHGLNRKSLLPDVIRVLIIAGSIVEIYFI